MQSKYNDENLVLINNLCAAIAFKGSDAKTFLDNFLISKLESLKKNAFNYSAICNPKGRIISSMWVNIISENEMILLVPLDLKQELLKFFSMRKFRMKLEISELELSIFLNLSNNEIGLLKEKHQEIKAIESSQFYIYLFNLNLPWIDGTNSEKHIPQHVNLDQHEKIISFTKGCYPGQEIVARIKYLGKIKKRMKLTKNKSNEKLIQQNENLTQVSPLIKNHKNNYFYQQVIMKT